MKMMTGIQSEVRSCCSTGYTRQMLSFRSETPEVTVACINVTCKCDAQKKQNKLNPNTPLVATSTRGNPALRPAFSLRLCNTRMLLQPDDETCWLRYIALMQDDWDGTGDRKSVV